MVSAVTFCTSIVVRHVPVLLAHESLREWRGNGGIRELEEREL